MDLTGEIPDIISDLLGYSVVPQQLQENQLLAGDTFNTTNVIKTGSGVNGVPAYIPVGIKTTTDMTQVCCCTCCCSITTLMCTLVSYKGAEFMYTWGFWVSWSGVDLC